MSAQNAEALPKCLLRVPRPRVNRLGMPSILALSTLAAEAQKANPVYTFIR